LAQQRASLLLRRLHAAALSFLHTLKSLSDRRPEERNCELILKPATVSNKMFSAGLPGLIPKVFRIPM
jgi:hypothetical protein